MAALPRPPPAPVPAPARWAATASTHPAGRARRRWRLSAHLLAFGMALVLPVLALGAASAWQVGLAYQSAFEARLRDTARALATALDSEFGSLMSVAATLAASPALKDRPDEALPSLQPWLAEISRALGGAAIMVSTTADPAVPLVASAEPDAPDDRPAEPLLALLQEVVASGGPGLSDMHPRGPDGRFAVTVAAPVPAAGAVHRVVQIAIDPARLSTLLAAQGMTGGATAGLADGRGINVARSRGYDRFVGVPAPWYRFAEGLEEGVFRGRNFEGVPIVFGYHRLHRGTGWGVVVGAPQAAYEASWRMPFERLALGAALAVALAISTAFALARRVLAPVRALEQQAEAVAAGTGSARTAAEPAPVMEFEALRQAIARADAALRAGAAEFRAVFEQAAIAMSQADPVTGQLLRVNGAYCALVGRPESDLIGRPFADLVHPDDREAILRDWRAMLRGELGAIETRNRYLRPDGTLRWTSGTISAIRDPFTGRLVRTLGAWQDVTEQRANEERQLLLMRELDHRAKNALAVVQAAVRLTPKHDPEAYAKAVEGRIAALARAHTLLAAARWAGADLGDIVRSELAAFLGGAGAGPQALLSGAPVTLRPTAAQGLSMVLHELATNAIKHGALSAPEGRLAVSWTLDAPAGRLRLLWQERGGPAIAGAPGRRGFGSRVLETTVKDQLGGSIARRWLPTGLACTIEAPLARLT